MNEIYSPGLEVDRGNQDEFPTAFNNSPQQLFEANAPQFAMSASTEKTAREPQGRTCGLRTSTMWLVIALVVTVVMGVIGASIAGSLAVSRQSHDNRDCNAEAEPSTITLISSVVFSSQALSFRVSGSTAGAPTATSTSSASPTVSLSARDPDFTGNASAATPSSSQTAAAECQSLKSPYSPIMPAGGPIAFPVEFDIQCGRDYDLPFFMAMHTITFEDCIFACASYTTLESSPDARCVVASFEASGTVSCWLKRSNGTTLAHDSDRVSVATLNSIV